MSYAVKHGAAQGAVFASYETAREAYHTLQGEGMDPVLAAGPSLTDAVCFLEGFSVASGSMESNRRQRWSEEERAARARYVVQMWGEAVETWKLGRRGSWISSSDDDTSDFDESSVSIE